MSSDHPLSAFYSTSCNVCKRFRFGSITCLRCHICTVVSITSHPKLFFLIIKPSYKQNRENPWRKWQELSILHTIEFCSRQKNATHWKSPSLNPNRQLRLFANRDYFVIVLYETKKDMISALSKSAPNLAQNFFFYSGHNLTKHRELIFTLGLGPLHFPPVDT